MSSAGDNRLGIGVIGAGGIARRKTIPAMLKASNVRVVAVMDPVGIEEIARQFKIEKAYKSERKLLADPEVQAVYIASPVHFHLKQIEMAAAAVSTSCARNRWGVPPARLVAPCRSARNMVSSFRKVT